MRYSLLALTLTAACSPVSEADHALIQLGDPTDGLHHAGASLLGSVGTPIPDLRLPVWGTVEPSDSLDVAFENANDGTGEASAETSHPSFANLSRAEREALVASQQGPQRLHGFLFANTDSEAALLEHYQGMPLATIHRMHLELEQLLSRRDRDQLPHTINGWPLNAEALHALKREQAWLQQRLYSQFEDHADSLLASYAQTGWEPGYLELDAAGVRYELWLTQQLLNRETGAAGRIQMFR